MNSTLRAVACLVLAGCGVSQLSSSSSDAEGRQSVPGGLASGALRYQPTAAELAAVRGAAAKWWPQAQVAVSPSRGTVATAFNLALPLRGCRDVALSALEQLSTLHDVFRLDGGEWEPRHALSCSQLPPDGAWVTLERVRGGKAPLAGQSLHLRVRRLGNAGWIDAAVGWYLPTLPDLEAELPRYESLSDAKLFVAAAEEALPYRVFDWCAPLFDSAYKVQADDALSVDEGRWHPADDGHGVTMVLQRTVRVEVAPANVTAELLQSDAHCPPLVGFAVTLDALHGKVLSQRAGLGCIVCAAP